MELLEVKQLPRMTLSWNLFSGTAFENLLCYVSSHSFCLGPIIKLLSSRCWSFWGVYSSLAYYLFPLHRMGVLLHCLYNVLYIERHFVLLSLKPMIWRGPFVYNACGVQHVCLAWIAFCDFLSCLDQLEHYTFEVGSVCGSLQVWQKSSLTLIRSSGLFCIFGAMHSPCYVS